MKKELILVNKSDQVVGYGEKIPIHKAGELHRAFSLFIYSRKEKKLLLQRRNEEKYHSGGKWSNACCSHPYKDETWYESLQRGASDELNISLNIEKNIQCDGRDQSRFIGERLLFSGAFVYFSDYKELFEHEFDYVFVYIVDSVIQDIVFNESEVSEIKWLTTSEIDDLTKRRPDDFSSWFDQAWSLAKKSLSLY